MSKRLPDFVYGRRHHDGRLRLPGKPHSGRRFQRDPQRWTVLHRGALPAYIDWDTFEQNQEQMAANRTRYRGTPRGGTALLGGLVSCGVCGRRMFTTYTENGREARYVCHQMALTFGAPRCQSISAQCVDALISAAMLEALSPSAKPSRGPKRWRRSGASSMRARKTLEISGAASRGFGGERTRSARLLEARLNGSRSGSRTSPGLRSRS